LEALLNIPFAITSIQRHLLAEGISNQPTLYKQILGVLSVFGYSQTLGLFGKAPLKENQKSKLFPLALGSRTRKIRGFFSGK